MAISWLSLVYLALVFICTSLISASLLTFPVDPGSGKIVVSPKLRITVKFPRGGFATTFREIPSEVTEKPWIKSIPGDRKIIMEVTLSDGFHVSVDGVRKPFSNPGHSSEGWLNHDNPLIDPADGNQITLPYIFALRRFVFLVCGLTRDLLELWWTASVQTAMDPSNYGHEEMEDEDREMSDLDGSPTTASALVQFKRSLHRDLLHVAGFYNSMQDLKDLDLGDSAYVSPGSVGTPFDLDNMPPLPCLDLMPKDMTALEALLQEAALSERDQERFKRHFKQVPLGLSLIRAVGSTTIPD